MGGDDSLDVQTIKGRKVGLIILMVIIAIGILISNGWLVIKAISSHSDKTVPWMFDGELLGAMPVDEDVDLGTDTPEAWSDFLVLVAKRGYESGYDVDVLTDLCQKGGESSGKVVEVLARGGLVVASSQPEAVGAIHYPNESTLVVEEEIALIRAPLGGMEEQQVFIPIASEAMVGEGHPFQGPLVMSLSFQGYEILFFKVLIGVVILDTLVLIVLGLAAVQYRSLTRELREKRLAVSEQHLISLGRMSAVLAHEIRNPLVGVKGYAQLMLEDGPDETSKEFLEIIRDEVMRVEELIVELLEYSKDRPMSLQPTTLKELVEEAIDVVAPAALERGVFIDPKKLSRDVVAEVDGPKLRRVFINLLGNAITAAEEGGKVEIAGHLEGNQVYLDIDDDGDGIPEGQRTRIFEPYFSTKTRGTGLGLALCKKIVTAHGGAIVATSSALGGARFTIRLPRWGGIDG